MEKQYFWEKNYISYWAVKNIKTNKDITVEKIKELKKEMQTEREWKLITQKHRNYLHFLFRSDKVFFNRTTRSNSYIERLI